MVSKTERICLHATTFGSQHLEYRFRSTVKSEPVENSHPTQHMETNIPVISGALQLTSSSVHNLVSLSRQLVCEASSSPHPFLMPLLGLEYSQVQDRYQLANNAVFS